MKISGKQVAAARALLGIGQSDLATASQVNVNTIMRFETEQNVPRPATVTALKVELERRGIEFLNGGEPGVRLKRRSTAEGQLSTD